MSLLVIQRAGDDQAAAGARILLATTDPSSVTSTVAALAADGHTVTVRSENAARSENLADYDLVVCVRLTNVARNDVTAAWLRNQVWPVLPILLGPDLGQINGGDTDSVAEYLGLFSDVEVNYAGSGTDVLRDVSTHAITAPYAGPSVQVLPEPSGNFRDRGTPAGVVLGMVLREGEGGAYMTAVSAGDTLTLGRGTAPKRAVVIGWMRINEPGYTAAGDVLLARSAAWALGRLADTDPEQPPAQTVVPGAATETDTARPVTIALTGGGGGAVTVTLGTVTETDTAPPVTTASGGAAQVVIGTATETDTARPVTADLTAVAGRLGTATEDDTALPVTASLASGPVVTPPSEAVTGNRAGGRDRLGSGAASWDPPVVAPPGPQGVIGAVDVAHAFTVPTVDGRGRPAYSVASVQRRRLRDRIVVGGRDVTYFRGTPTPFPGFPLTEPLMYGPTRIVFPQIASAFEVPGQGALRWLRPFAPVLLQRVDPETGRVVATDYRGLILSFDHSGDELSCTVGGEASGRAALQNRQVPLFPGRNDLGYWASRAIQELGLRFYPSDGPTTGIKARAWGGQSMLEYLSQIVAMSYTRSGNRWTIMPTANGLYRMSRKDRTTIAGTVYADDSRTVAALNRDLTEEPNRIFMTGVTPKGQRVRFGAYPGLIQSDKRPPYPYRNGRSFGAGTTDADTDTGDGITVLVGRLRVTGYLDFDDSPGGYDGDVTRALRELQRDADLNPTGRVNTATWRALYDLDTTGFSLRWSKILPAAERRKVRPYRRSSSGAILGKNPGYDPTVPKVDRNVDAGVGFTRPQLQEWARTELDDADDTNYVGTLTFNTGALVRGTHTPGGPLAASDLMPARALRPGMNLRLPLFAGGITVHVSAVTVAQDGTVAATVDTRARDAAEVWEVIERNRESRRSPHREWLRDHRGSTQTKDALTTWDEVGGLLGANVTLPARKWVVVPVVAGQEGTVRSLRLRVAPVAEFVVAAFGTALGPRVLAQAIGDPLTRKGSRRWESETILNSLDRRHTLLYVAGSDEAPCGYYPRNKAEEKTRPDGSPETAPPAPLTGRWRDDAGFSYRTTAEPVIYLAFFADRETRLQDGRIMQVQLESGS